MKENMKQKRILILGIGEAQKNLIRVAKELGYYTIVCDMRSGMPGEEIVDKYYKINYMDRSAILKVAREEAIDGVISNSEPAMPNVSYLVDALGLPGNSLESIQGLLSKSRFREIQRSIGIFAPDSYESSSFETAISNISRLHFPIIIKPSESSGSRGTTRIDTFNKEIIRVAFDQCKQYSRSGNVTLEEYVPMVGSDVYNADIFVVDGNILWDGWYSGKRSGLLPMVPMAKILPPIISDENEQRIEKIVNRIIEASKVSLGEFNVETYITTANEVFVIEINPRQAGDDIPRLIYEHSGIDLTKLLVSLSVNDTKYYEEIKHKKRECNYITLQVVFPHQKGIYEGLSIHKDLKKYVRWIHEFVVAGTPVEPAQNAEDSVAYVDLRFDSRASQIMFTNDIENYIFAIIK